MFAAWFFCVMYSEMYFLFLAVWSVYHLHYCHAVLLAGPAEITVWLPKDNVWQLTAAVARVYRKLCITLLGLHTITDAGSDGFTTGKVIVPDFLNTIGSIQVLWYSYVEQTLCIYTYYSSVSWLSIYCIALKFWLYFQWWYLVNKLLMLIFLL